MQKDFRSAVRATICKITPRPRMYAVSRPFHPRRPLVLEIIAPHFNRHNNEVSIAADLKLKSFSSSECWLWQHRMGWVQGRIALSTITPEGRSCVNRRQSFYFRDRRAPLVTLSKKLDVFIFDMYLWKYNFSYLYESRLHEYFVQE